VVADDAGTGAEAPASQPSACEESRSITFRLSLDGPSSSGEAIRVAKGTPLALVSSGRVVGTFTDAAVSDCLASGFTFDGVVTAVGESEGTAELRGH
jgi:hypothetical protein